MAKAIAKQKITQEAYETALKNYVHSDNACDTLLAKRDKDVGMLNEKYNPQLNEYRESMEADFEVVKQYCEENRVEIFTDAKSIEEHGADIGFREGKDKVVVLNSVVGEELTDKEAEKKALELVLKSASMKKYTRTTVSLDKAAIIKNKPKGMQACGIDVIKEESFFLEPVKSKK